jgi:hypothetical protein
MVFHSCLTLGGGIENGLARVGIRSSAVHIAAAFRYTKTVQSLQIQLYELENCRHVVMRKLRAM